MVLYSLQSFQVLLIGKAEYNTKAIIITDNEESSAEDILNTLIDEKLIETKNSPKLVFVLTTKGQKVAKLLKEVLFILSNVIYLENMDLKGSISIESAFKFFLSPALLEL